ncbi:[protein-PII] uridylyltransferase family protein [Thermodesulfatator atlanticus]
MRDSFKCREIPDEDWSRQNLERLKDAHPHLPWDKLSGENFFALSSLVGFSPYITSLLTRREEFVLLFLKEKIPNPSGKQALLKEILKKAAAIKDWKEFARLLRWFKQREFIKILALDFLGRSFLRSVSSITALAEATLNASLVWLTENLFPREMRERFFVLGMGKFGARELNYSSDIDIIYFYHAPLNEKERYISLAREITRLMDSLIESERVFRVDLGLRPGGKDGELVCSAKAGLNYYFYQSHPFERLALVKARPVAGNIHMGKAFLRNLRPVIYPHFLDFGYLEHIKDLKKRIEAEARKSGAEKNIKIGPGGIRSIEFFCQTLQMVFGGKIPDLRTRNTLWAINKLAQHGIVPEEEAKFLKNAYVFLRQVEHRIQTVHFRQTYTLPQEEAALERLAKSLGYAGHRAKDDFLADLNKIRKRSELIFSSLLEPQETRKTQDINELIEALLDGERRTQEIADLLKIPVHLLEEVKHILSVKGPLGRRRISLLKEILVETFKYLQEFENSGEVLAKFLAFVERLGGRLSFYYALKHEPEKIKELLFVFEKSNFLTNLLREAPGAAEALFKLEDSFCIPQASPSSNLEEALGMLRMAKNEELFRLGYLDLNQKLDLLTLLTRLSNLAEGILKETLNLALRERNQEESLLTVLGLGKLGGKELGYRSDLDMVFITSKDEDIVSATKVAQQFIHFLTVPLPEGPGYQVDTRLRPEGRKGPLVTTLKGFLTYHAKDSGLWEKLALLRLRPVAGNEELGQKVVQEIKELLSSFNFGPKEAEELRNMRFKMEKERTKKGLVNLKVGRGGLADIEFIVQWLVLKNIAQDIWEESTVKALDKLAGSNLLDNALAEKLKNNYLFLRRLEQLLILVFDKPGEEKEYLPEEIKGLKSYLGKDIWDRLNTSFEENRKIFEKLLA